MLPLGQAWDKKASENVDDLSLLDISFITPYNHYMTTLIGGILSQGSGRTMTQRICADKTILVQSQGISGKTHLM